MGWAGGGGRGLRKREMLHVACVSLDKAPPVTVLEVLKCFIESYAITFLCQ